MTNERLKEIGLRLASAKEVVFTGINVAGKAYDYYIEDIPELLIYIEKLEKKLTQYEDIGEPHELVKQECNNLELTPDEVSQWLYDNGYEDMSKIIDCDFEL